LWTEKFQNDRIEANQPLCGEVRRMVPPPFKRLKNIESLISIYNHLDFIIYCSEKQITDNQIIIVAYSEDLSLSELAKNICYYNSKYKYNARIFPLPVVMLKIIFTLFKRKDLIKKLLYSLQIDKKEQTKKYL